MSGVLIATLFLFYNSEQQFFDKEPYINPFAITHFFGGFKHGGMTSTRIVVTEAIDNAWREVEMNNDFIVSRSQNERSSYRVIGKTSNDVYALIVSGNHGGTLSEVNLMIVSLKEAPTNELNLIESIKRGKAKLRPSELTMTKPTSSEKKKELHIVVHAHASVYRNLCRDFKMDGDVLRFTGESDETGEVQTYSLDLSDINAKPQNPQTRSGSKRSPVGLGRTPPKN